MGSSHTELLAQKCILHRGLRFSGSRSKCEGQKRELLNGVAGLDDFGPLLYSTSQDNVTLGNSMLSYVSIMDAFGQLLVGAVTTYHYGTVKPMNTLVLSTGLRSQISDDVYNDHITTNATFARAVENLFENITMSLLSSNDFIVDLWVILTLCPLL